MRTSGEGKNFLSHQKKFFPSPDPSSFFKKRGFFAGRAPRPPRPPPAAETSAPVCRGGCSLRSQLALHRPKRYGECCRIRLFKHRCAARSSPYSSVLIRTHPYPSVQNSGCGGQVEAGAPAGTAFTRPRCAADKTSVSYRECPAGRRARGGASGQAQDERNSATGGATIRNAP